MHYLISKALRFGPCVTKASPSFGWYQLILLGEQRHMGVRNLPRVFTLRARPRVEPTTS